METAHLKEIALDQAVRLRDKITDPDKIVEAAKLFFDFLNGDKGK